MNGHPLAREYPLWLLWLESSIIKKIQNQVLITQGFVTQKAVGALLDKDGHKEWLELVEKLSNGD